MTISGSDFWKKTYGDVIAGRNPNYTRKTSGALPSLADWTASNYRPEVRDMTQGRTLFDDYGNATGKRGRLVETGIHGNLPPEAAYLYDFYNVPSYQDNSIFAKLPTIAATAFGTAGALGGLDQFAAGAGGTGTATGTLAAEAAPIAGSTGPGVSPAFDPSMGGGYWNPSVDAGTAVTGAGTTGTPLSRLLGLDQRTSDLLSVGGTVGATALGAYGSNRRANALENIANRSRADRAPFLNAATNYLNNPSAYINGPGQAALKGTLHGLSAKFGNPIGSAAALQIATDSALQDWRNATTGFANIGLSGEDSRNQLMAGSAGADLDTLTTIAGGASDILNPRRRSLADLAREARSAGLI